MLIVKPQKGQRIIHQERIGTVQSNQDGGMDPVRVQIETHWLGGVRLVLITGLYIAQFTRHEDENAAIEAAHSWLEERTLFFQADIEQHFTIVQHSVSA